MAGGPDEPSELGIRSLHSKIGQEIEVPLGDSTSAALIHLDPLHAVLGFVLSTGSPLLVQMVLSRNRLGSDRACLDRNAQSPTRTSPRV